MNSTSAPSSPLPLVTTHASLSLILAVLAWCGLGVFTGVPAIFFGISGYRQLKDYPNSMDSTAQSLLCSLGIWGGLGASLLMIILLTLLVYMGFGG
jgi:hypothetical protein